MRFSETVEHDHAVLLPFLHDQGFTIGVDALETLHGDGSDRRFYRVHHAQGLVAVFPSLTHPKRMQEARSTYMIGYHLYDLGVATPKIIGHLRDAGLVLMDDVGSTHLQAQVLKCRSSAEKTDLYLKAVTVLLTFQIDGVQGFDARSCWDTPKYDYELMVTRESDYFLKAFCREYAGVHFDEPGLKKECMAIAYNASREPAGFLLHRDFQSRNLMVHHNEIRIIDFQGARFGPLAYDLASLLYDPYVQLSPLERETIFEYYVKEARSRVSLDADRFKIGYVYLALQRVLQMLGAFGFLTIHKGKVFFEPFIQPALENLRSLLMQLPGEYPLLSSLTKELLEELDECRSFSSP
jgi:aminoglycoside/choline kinase family phosphotransferase